MRYHKKVRRQVEAWLLSTVLICSAIQLPTMAAVDGKEGTTCHAGVENCSYVEAVEGAACTHEHDEACYEEILECTHEHDESCRNGEASPSEITCGHEHDESCYKKVLRCTHEHDGACGYVKAVKGVKCDHECEICGTTENAPKKEDSDPDLKEEKPEEKQAANKLLAPVSRAAKGAESTGDFSVECNNYTYSENDGTLTIKADAVIGMKNAESASMEQIIIDTTSNKTINVTLNGVNIDISDTTGYSNKSAITAKTGSDGTVNLLLADNSENVLAADKGAAIEIAGGGKLTIDGDGALDVSSRKGAGIGKSGGDSTETAGTDQDKNASIEIKGGYITAKSTVGAAIGGGYQHNIGDITISGGEINASNQSDSSLIGAGRGTAIGGGYDGSVGKILITGAGTAVTVENNGATGIGGSVGKVESITISEATVKVATNSTSGTTAIGVYTSASVGSVTIKDGANVDIGMSQLGIGSVEEGNINISITDSEVKMAHVNAGIISKGSKRSGSGDIEIKNSDVYMAVNNSGITGSGSIKINGSSNVDITVSNEEPGIKVEKDLEIANSRVRVTVSGDRIAISGKGDVKLRSGADVILDAGRYAISLTGDASDITCEAGSTLNAKVRAYSNDAALDANSVNIAAGAGIFFTARDKTQVFFKEGTVACPVLVLQSKNDSWEDHRVEIRNKDGVSLNPILAFAIEGSCRSMMITLPAEGDYTFYYDGELQQYEGEDGSMQSIMTVKKGVNEIKNLLITGGSGGDPAPGNMYQLTIPDNATGLAKTIRCKAGTRVPLHAGTLAGYTFERWETNGLNQAVDDIHSPDTFLIMPSADLQIAIIWNQSGSGQTTSSSSSGSSKDRDYDWITKKYSGGAARSDAVWTMRSDGSWTAAIGGQTPADEWVCLNNPYASVGQAKGGWFYFDAAGSMMTGWLTDKTGNRFYLNPLPDGTRGQMQVGWVWIDGKCYYFRVPDAGGILGALVVSGQTPDGKEVDATGAWTVNGVVQTQ